MKKVKLFFTAVAMVLGLSAYAQGDVVEGYTCDFNTTISTSDHDFKVAPGWSHIVDKKAGYWSDTYASYTYYSTGGVDNSGRLLCQTQSYSGLCDLLVTPAITGKMTIAVKGSSSYYQKIIFYYINEDGTKGDTIKTATASADLNTTDFVTYTIEGLQNQKVGIWGNSVSLDNFTADNAVIVLEKKLAIQSSSYGTKILSSTAPDCDANNNYTVSAQVVVKNTGECALDPEDASVSLYNYSIGTDRIIATLPLNKTLAVGDTAHLILTGTANYDTDCYVSSYDQSVNHRCGWYAIESIGKTTQYIAWIEPTPYLPILKVANSDGTQTSPVTKDFGYMNADKTQTYTISNSGAAPLTITEIAVPAKGFAVVVTKGDVTLSTPFILEARSYATVTVTALSSEIGTYNDSIVIKGEGVDAFRINLASTVLDANKLYANFDECAGKIPAGFKYDSNVWSAYNYNQGNNKYCLKSSKQFGYDYDYMLSTPLLEVTGVDDEMTFEVAKQSAYSDSEINVYYSSDRKNWVSVDSIKADEFSTDKESSYPYNYKFKQFSIKGIPAGNWYIGFESGYAYLDNIYGFKQVEVAHDVDLTKTTVPASAMQNYSYSVSATAWNINDKADNVYAELYVDDVKVATSEAQDIEAGKTATFTLTAIPHETGKHGVYVKIVAGDLVVSSAVDSINVTEEVANAEVVVGNASSSLSSSYGVIKGNYYNTQTETIYTAEKLAAAGLKAGDKISSMTFRGVTSTESTRTVQFYISNTDNVTVADPINGSIADMTKVFDGDYTIAKTAGTSTADAADLITINFAEPFIYDGGNLRVASKSTSTTCPSISWEIDNTDKTGSITYQKYKDDATQCASATMSSGSTWGGNYPLPVAHFGLQVEDMTVEAIVTDAQTEAAIENAVVEIKNAENDVIYTGTTDDAGYVVIPVIQNTLAYTVTVAKDGYKTATVVEDANLFTEGNVATYNVNLELSTPTAISEVATANNKNAARYNLAGQRVSSTAKGIVIMNGKKMLVK